MSKLMDYFQQSCHCGNWSASRAGIAHGPICMWPDVHQAKCMRGRGHAWLNACMVVGIINCMANCMHGQGSTRLNVHVIDNTTLTEAHMVEGVTWSNACLTEGIV